MHSGHTYQTTVKCELVQTVDFRIGLGYGIGLLSVHIDEHDELHWLDIPECVHYKLGVTVHRCLHDKAPKYLVDCYTPVSDICQQTTSALCQSTSPDSTTLPAQYFWSSGLLCHRSDGLEFTTGQSQWPGAQQQWSFPTTVEDKLILALPLSTHSAAQMLHDSALYKFMTDIDIFWCFWDVLFWTYWPTPVRQVTWPCDLDFWPWRSRQLSLLRVFMLRLCTKFELRRSSHSEDIGYILREH